MAKKSAASEDDGQLLTFTGYVDPHEWNDDGDLMLVSVSTDDERYVVVPEGKGKEMIDIVDAEVKVTGRVQRGEDGELHLTVTKFETIEFDYAADDDEDDKDEPDAGGDDWGKDDNWDDAPRARR